MHPKVNKFLQTVGPFLVLGVSVALILALLFIFTYILIWGLIIGGIIWGIAAIKRYLFPAPPPPPINKEKGRIIEHDIKNK